jgi:hypothetical protein
MEMRKVDAQNELKRKLLRTVLTRMSRGMLTAGWNSFNLYNAFMIQKEKDIEREKMLLGRMMKAILFSSMHKVMNQWTGIVRHPNQVEAVARTVLIKMTHSLEYSAFFKWRDDVTREIEEQQRAFTTMQKTIRRAPSQKLHAEWFAWSTYLAEKEAKEHRDAVIADVHNNIATSRDKQPQAMARQRQMVLMTKAVNKVMKGALVKGFDAWTGHIQKCIALELEKERAI